MPMTPPPLAMVLRKHLKNARMVGVRQLGFDRVLAFDFDTKHGSYHLYVEVFRDGNIILTNEDGIIIQPLTHASYAGRTLKKGVEYQPPPAAMDPHELDQSTLADLFATSDRDLVSTLGGKANLGGTHANAVCDLAKMEPNIATQEADVGAIHAALQTLLCSLAEERKGILLMKPNQEKDRAALEAEAQAFEANGLRDRFYEAHAVEATPTILPSHSNLAQAMFPSLCEAVDAWKGAHDAGALARRDGLEGVQGGRHLRGRQAHQGRAARAAADHGEVHAQLPVHPLLQLVEQGDRRDQEPVPPAHFVRVRRVVSISGSK